MAGRNRRLRATPRGQLPPAARTAAGVLCGRRSLRSLRSLRRQRQPLSLETCPRRHKRSRLKVPASRRCWRAALFARSIRQRRPTTLGCEPVRIVRFPATPRTPANEVLAGAVVAGLSLVTTPFVVPPPPLPQLPVDLVLSLVEQLLAGVSVDGLPQSLLDQLRSAVDVPAPDEAAPELPVKVMSDAIAVWTD